MTGNAPTHTCSYFCDKPECIKAQRDELREKLAALDSQPVPVEPEIISEFATHAAGHKAYDIGITPKQINELVKYIDTLRAYAVQMKAENEKWQERVFEFDTCIQEVADELGTCCGGVDGDQTEPLSTTQVLLKAIRHIKQRAEKAEATNQRMVELLKEPSEGMKDAAYKVVTGGYSDLCSKDEIRRADCLEIFKAMSAALLKEVGQ